MYINMYNKPIRDIRVPSRKVFFSLFAYCSSLLFLVGPIDVPNTFPSASSSRGVASPLPLITEPAGLSTLPRSASTNHSFPPALDPRFVRSIRSSSPVLSMILKINPPCVSSREPPSRGLQFSVRATSPPHFVFEEKNRFCAFSVIVSFFFCFFWVFFFFGKQVFEDHSILRLRKYRSDDVPSSSGTRSRRLVPIFDPFAYDHLSGGRVLLPVAFWRGEIDPLEEWRFLLFRRDEKWGEGKDG